MQMEVRRLTGFLSDAVREPTSVFLVVDGIVGCGLKVIHRGFHIDSQKVFAVTFLLPSHDCLLVIVEAAGTRCVLRSVIVNSR